VAPKRVGDECIPTAEDEASSSSSFYIVYRLCCVFIIRLRPSFVGGIFEAFISNHFQTVQIGLRETQIRYVGGAYVNTDGHGRMTRNANKPS
jgi:hypothetical protein